MDVRIMSKILEAGDKPWPELQCYMTIKDLSERYDVSKRTIRRWADENILPLDIDSELGIRRWDIEELEEFEDDVRIQAESNNP